MKNKDEFISKLHGCTNFTQHHKQIEAWSKSPAILYELYLKIKRRKHLREEHGSFLRTILCSLTLTSSERNIYYTFQLVFKYVHALKLRQIANMLAAEQSTQLLLDIIGQNLRKKKLHGFYRMLLHELIIKEKTKGFETTLEQLSGKLTKSRLAVLPLNLTPVEARLFSKDYSIMSASIPTPLYNGGVPINYEEKFVSGGNAIELTNDEPMRGQCLAAVNNWLVESNGKQVVRMATIKQGIPDAEEIIGTLFSDIFAKGTKLNIAKCVPSRVFSMLYSAASSGGAYSSGEEGAYGRLKAWYSFLGLCSIEFQSNKIMETIADLDNYIWFEFISDVWFYRQLHWDIGLICIDKRNKRIYSLIASDTD